METDSARHGSDGLLEKRPRSPIGIGGIGMKNGLGVPQSVVLFGGTSDIGQAILRKIVKTGMSHVVLVSRNVAAAEAFSNELRSAHPGLTVHHVQFDATKAESMSRVVGEVTSVCSDIDIAIVAQALLGEGTDFFANPDASIEISTVNYTSTMVLLLSLAQRLRQQRYGKIVVLSSVAGERVRRSNAVYGASKAGIDAFAQALDHELSEAGASLLVVRPGFVHSKMTAGLQPVPFSTTPEKVATRTAKAIDRNSRVIWVPGILRPVMSVFRHLPTVVWRRLPV